MKNKIKILIVTLISFLPINKFRIFCYRYLLNYKISYDSKIGMLNFINAIIFEATHVTIGSFNVISAKEIRLESNSKIRNRNRIKWLKQIVIHEGGEIVSGNVIIGMKNQELLPYSDVCTFELGKGSIITRNHLFDCTANIKINTNVVFGGSGTQVWTHGFDIDRTMLLGNVSFGNNIYIGSRCMILQNVDICNNVSIGAATTVSKSILASGFYTSSTLILKSLLKNQDDVDFSGEYRFKFQR